ncbi:hypothetical protein GCM10027447_26160 [Glycomyces halotolerans]
MGDTSRLRSPSAGTVERGRFTDGLRTFEVRASSAEAPDSFQVYTDGNCEDIVLIVSGLNSGDLKATWGRNWRSASEGWREWAEVSAFMVFHNGDRSAIGRIRVCDD